MNIKHILRKDGENDIKLRSRIKKEHQLADLSKKVERLQEQLNEANEALKCIRHQVKIGEFPCDACGYSMECEGCWCGDTANDYLEKWGVK